MTSFKAASTSTARFGRVKLSSFALGGLLGFVSFLHRASVWRTFRFCAATSAAACRIRSSLGSPSRTLAWPKLSLPPLTIRRTSSGRASRRRLLVTALRLLPSFFAADSCVKPYLSISCRQPSATSMGSRSSRCRFSISASAAACSSVTSLMMTGTSSSPARRAARQRRSPAMMMYPGPTFLGRTAMGCKSPFSVMLSASWFSASSSNRLRGCSGSGSISRSGSVELDASLPVSSDRSANRLSSPLPSPPIFFLAIGVPPYRSLFAKNSRANSMYASLPLPFGS